MGINSFNYNYPGKKSCIVNIFTSFTLFFRFKSVILNHFQSFSFFFQSFSVIDVHKNPEKIQNLQYFYHLRITPFKKSFLC